MLTVTYRLMLPGCGCLAATGYAASGIYPTARGMQGLVAKIGTMLPNKTAREEVFARRDSSATQRQSSRYLQIQLMNTRK